MRRTVRARSLGCRCVEPCRPCSAKHGHDSRARCPHSCVWYDLASSPHCNTSFFLHYQVEVTPLWPLLPCCPKSFSYPPPKKKDRKGEIFLYVSKLCIYKHSASGLSSCTNVQKMKIGLLQIETENYGRTSKSIQFFTSGSKLVPTKKVHLRNTLF